MKLFLFLITLIATSFGQYANEMVVNGDFGSATGWSVQPKWVISGGQAAIDGTQSAAQLIYQAGRGIAINTTYRYEFDITITAGGFAIRHSSTAYVPEYGGITLTGSNTYTFTTTGTAYDNIAFSADVDLVAVLDNVSARQKIDTLYTFPTMADETDNDTTKTLSEAFVTRGAHSGGTFISESATFDETVTIDSSFTLWRSATAGVGTYVTAVDFANVTATLLDVYVTTPTNDSNITYTYTSTATTDTPKRKFGGYGVWGGW